MKINKIIALLLICILLSCISLCACSLQEIIDKIMPTTAAEPKEEPQKLPDGVIETTVTDSNGNEITIAHTDNFTQDDIEFVLMFHGEKLGGYDKTPIESYPAPKPKLEDVVSGVNHSNMPLFLMHFENPYFICGYEKLNLPEYEKDENGYYYSDVTRQIWCKFEKVDDPPEMLEESYNRVYINLLYDCTIKENIITGEELNINCKYYLMYKNSSYGDIVKKDMVMFFIDGYEKINDTKFVEYIYNDHFSAEVYINEYGSEYLYFAHESYQPDGSIYQNYSQDEFGEYYDILSSHFEVLEEKSSNNKVVSYAGIDLDILSQFLFK